MARTIIYRKRKISLNLILINIILLGLLNGVLALDRHLNPPIEWKEAPVLPDGLRSDMLHLNPGFSGVSLTGITYTVNDWGYRDDPIDMSKQHIVFLGDSTTFGLNIEHADTFAEVWERSVGGDCQAVNTAVPGHGTITEYAELKKLLTRGLNIRAVVVGFFAQNSRHGTWDNTTWENSAKYLHKIHELTMETGVEMVILLLPSRASDVLEGAIEQPLLVELTTQEHIPLVDGIHIYQTYLQQHQLTDIPDTFYNEGKDLGHPNALTSHLLGEALAGVLPCREDDR